MCTSDNRMKIECFKTLKVLFYLIGRYYFSLECSKIGTSECKNYLSLTFRFGQAALLNESKPFVLVIDPVLQDSRI